MGPQRHRELATADGHDRHVPSGSKDFLSVGHEGVYEWAVDHLLPDGGSFLDLGCGTGYGASFVVASGATYDGVDTSPAAVAYARDNYGRPGVRFFVADLMEPPPEELAPASYDLVFSSEVIEHVVDPFAFVEAMAGFVRDDGACLVGTPNRLWSREHMPGGGLMARSHVMELTPPALEALLGTAFGQVALMFRVFPEEAIRTAVVPAGRPRLLRGAAAFAREVAPPAVVRYLAGDGRGRGGKEWSSQDIRWVSAGDPELDPARSVGLVAVCRSPRR